MMVRKSKIVATIGPATANLDVLVQAFTAGVDIIRINSSHGDDREHLLYIDLVRKASKKSSKPIPILLDLQGPKIRLGDLENTPIKLTNGSEIVITNKPVTGNANTLSVNFPNLSQYAKPNMRVLIDDGKIALTILKVLDDKVFAKVINGGDVYPQKGVNFPDLEEYLSGFTDFDRQKLKFGMTNGVDLIAASFVRNAQDIITIRDFITTELNHPTIPIIAKIELASGLKNLNEILSVTDGVMVARGDLAVEISAEKVPIAQKQIIEAANQSGKYVITATQMLESMINSPTPTRAEAADIANAIFDGSDALMLSEETAIGSFPIESITIMDAIIRESEVHLESWARWSGNSWIDKMDEDAYFIAKAAKDLAYDRDVGAICVFTLSGNSALIVSKTRPPVPIFAFTPRREVYNRLGIYWGVIPIFIEEASTIEEMLLIIDNHLLKSKLLKPSDQVVVVCGFPIKDYKPPNLTLLHTLG
ncbi:MAG: pyruvate kinase [Anaerolineales bacterium]